MCLSLWQPDWMACSRMQRDKWMCIHFYYNVYNVYLFFYFILKSKICAQIDIYCLLTPLSKYLTSLIISVLCKVPGSAVHITVIIIQCIQQYDIIILLIFIQNTESQWRLIWLGSLLHSHSFLWHCTIWLIFIHLLLGQQKKNMQVLWLFVKDENNVNNVITCIIVLITKLSELFKFSP